MKKNYLFVITLIAFLCVGVINVNATSTDHIDSILTNGKLVLKTIEPNSISDVNMKIDTFDDIFRTTLGADYKYSCVIDFTTCTIYYHYDQSDEESKEVSVEYDYDPKVKEMIDEYLENLNEGKRSFIVTDLELVNYWVNNSENTTLLSFSEEYKSYFEYKNFIPYIDVRGGGGTGEFTDSNIGIAKLKYNDTLYYVEDHFGAFTRNIIYVPNDTADENVLDVVQARIEEYIGEDNSVLISEVNTVESYIQGYIANAQALDEMEFEEYGYDNNYYESANLAINDTNGDLHFLKDENIAPIYYEITINGDLEHPYYFVVIKDSTKIQTPKFKTTDVNSDISISSLNNNIPLDTLINVKKLISGEEYERIIDILEATNTEMFDLSLFSKSANDYITELEDGTFEVRIPIAEAYRNKFISVYYVDEEDTKHEYEVTVENNYAVFNTNHFSVYTLVASDKIIYDVLEGDKQKITSGEEKDLIIKIDADYDLFDKLYLNNEELDNEYFTVAEGSTIVTLKGSLLSKLEAGTYNLKVTFTNGGEVATTFTVESPNPKTSDGIISFILIGIISLMGISFFVKKEKI